MPAARSIVCLFAIFVGICTAYPNPKPPKPTVPSAAIIEYVNENDGSGNYNYFFRTSDGMVRQEAGRLVNQGTDDEYMEVTGCYTYLDSNHEVVRVYYQADKNGYNVVEETNYLKRNPYGPVKRAARTHDYCAI